MMCKQNYILCFACDREATHMVADLVVFPREYDFLCLHCVALSLEKRRYPNGVTIRKRKTNEYIQKS